jgi:hypothetical protein
LPKSGRTLLAAAGICALALPSASSAADSPETDPTGIYCSCGSTTPTKVSLAANIAPLRFVSGVLVRALWSDLEPSEDQYDWGFLDNELAAAQSDGKRVTLAILNGPSAPAWLSAKGAAFFTSTSGATPVTLPVPWDPIYLPAWTSFVKALGAHYQNNPAIALIHMTNSTGNGFEMWLPFATADVANWQKIGYTPDLEIASWETVIDAFRAAFPATLLDVEVHPILNSNQVAQSVVDYGYSTMGSRFGVFASWWSRHNGTDVYPGMYALIQRGVAASYANVQMVQSQKLTPSFDLSDAIAFARSTGIRYMEVWNADLTDTDFATLLISTAASLAVPEGPHERRHRP